jgi:hypothetical protein
MLIFINFADWGLGLSAKLCSGVNARFSEQRGDAIAPAPKHISKKQIETPDRDILWIY